MSEELEVKLDDSLEEAKATGEDSENMDPVTPAGGAAKGKNRKADVNKSVDPKADNVEDHVKTPQGSHDVGLKEAFEGLFEGSDLSEEFKTKTLAVFEAAVHQKVLEEKASLEEKFEMDLEEQVKIATDEIVEKVDSYLDYVVENWMKENEVAIESSIKVEVAESLLNGITNLVTEHRLDIDDETVDVVSEMEEKMNATTEKYNEVVEQLIAVKEEKETLERSLAFAEIAEGLTDTQVDKLKVLSEGVSFETLEEYATKVSAIKESYFTEAVTTSVDETEYLEEEVEEPVKVSVDPTVARYAESISRLAK